jgi:anti-sigma B factor antagonist
MTVGTTRRVAEVSDGTEGEGVIAVDRPAILGTMWPGTPTTLRRGEYSVVDVEVVQDGTTTICRPDGELDAFTVAAFRQQLADLAGIAAVIIDLSLVPFMDSAGLGALIGGIRKIREAAGEVVVVCDRAAVLRLLHTTRFDRMVTVVAGVAEAHLALAEAPTA